MMGELTLVDVHRLFDRQQRSIDRSVVDTEERDKIRFATVRVETGSIDRRKDITRISCIASKTATRWKRCAERHSTRCGRRRHGQSRIGGGEWKAKRQWLSECNVAEKRMSHLRIVKRW